mmetsp:Transcript_4350/g.27678  ORF Transcript_4350/g.27678 Transcript_4350/m.27678 type:complete len:109 (-) Transcript_4350:157-483(-)
MQRKVSTGEWWSKMQPSWSSNVHTVCGSRRLRDFHALTLHLPSSKCPGPNTLQECTTSLKISVSVWLRRQQRINDSQSAEHDVVNGSDLLGTESGNEQVGSHLLVQRF